MLARIPLVLWFAPMIAGCTTKNWCRSEAIKYTKFVSVEIERLADGGNPADPGYAHPARVPEDKVRRLFETLTYEREGKRKVTVRSDGTDVLARAIVTGLARCDATSRVRFNVQNPGEKEFILSNPTTTRGVVFVKPAGVLNVAFQAVDHLYDFHDDADWLDPTRGPDVPENLVLPESARFHVAKDGSVNTMWFTYPVGDTAPASPAAAPAESPPEKAKPETSSAEKLTSEQTLDRLRYLEELREKGLISEEKYRQERKRLLEK